MTQEIISTIATHICTEMIKQPKRQLDPAEALISSGVIDPFHLVDLALFVEDTYGVLIDDSELNKDTFDNLNQLVELIQSRQA